MRLPLLLLVSLTITACETTEQHPPADTPFSQLSQLVDQYAEEALRKGHLNAISLAIYRNGETYHQHYGELTKDSGTKPDDRTLYEIASVSKVFLGSLVARAVLEEKLMLEDDIRKYLPGEYPNLSFAGTPVTVKNLVTHTLGFSAPEQLDSTYSKAFRGYYTTRPLDYEMDNFLRELKTVELTAEPGTVYAYNNVGSELAAYVLEQVYDRPYQELLQDFLEELGMQETYLQEFEQHQDRVAAGYNEANEPAGRVKLPLLGASGGLISTLPDLTQLLKFQLESNSPIVKEATKTLFEDDEGNVVGYLWEDMGVAEEEGFFYLKTGDANGTKSGVLLCPDSHYGQVVIVNNQTEAATNDWLALFYQIETDLIKYPKLNLKSIVKPAFIADKASGKQ
ncbi:MAG: serine hydrolase domain-containing protein, partial [Bacteroidota bacterium]